MPFPLLFVPLAALTAKTVATAAAEAAVATIASAVTHDIYQEVKKMANSENECTQREEDSTQKG